MKKILLTIVTCIQNEKRILNQVSNLKSFNLDSGSGWTLTSSFDKNVNHFNISQLLSNITLPNTGSYLVTGSGYFLLGGGKFSSSFLTITSSISPFNEIEGPALSIIHTFNQLLKQKTFGLTDGNQGGPGI